MSPIRCLVHCLLPLLSLSILTVGLAQATNAGLASHENPGALVLHVVAINEQSPCSGGFVPAGSVVTAAESREDGSARYLVYVLGVPEGRSENEHWGIAGVELGIQYDPGVMVDDWRTCADLEFVGSEWPTSESGTLVTWEYNNNCQRSDWVVVGFFTTSARNPSVMSIIPRPGSGLVRIADCDGSATDLTPIEVDRVGWVSFGGAAKGADADGCNPVLEPCNSDVVPAYPVTWGRLKSKSWK